MAVHAFDGKRDLHPRRCVITRRGLRTTSRPDLGVSATPRALTTPMPVLPPFLRYEPSDPLLFHEPEFLAWFAAALMGALLLHRWRRAQTAWLTVFSFLVYYRIAGVFAGLLAGTIVFDYLIARVLDATEGPVKRRLLVVLSLVANLGLLGWFKYAGLLAETIRTLTEMPWHPVAWALPAGISFYTFQSLSYTIDVYRRDLPAARSLLDYAFFVSFFPQLVAGPIVRAADFLPQLPAVRLPARRAMGAAIGLFAIGLAKKVLVADPLATRLVDPIFAEPTRHAAVEQLLAIYGYAIQIYADFSGYSDMAIGLAAALGFTLPLNFDRPYSATSITDFWRRWHLSLSTWLRDYLYIPLGGNRRGRVRTYANLLIVMLLGGLWHGAAWRFGVWGLLHGGMLAVERATGWAEWISRSRPRRLLGRLLTFHLVCVCWVFFRAESVATATAMLRSVGEIATAASVRIATTPLLAHLPMAVLVTTILVAHLTPTRWRQRALRQVAAGGPVLQALVLVALLWAAASVQQVGARPFIYFAF